MQKYILICFIVCLQHFLTQIFQAKDQSRSLFCSHINGTCPFSFKRILIAQETNYVVFQLFYAHIALWEKPLLSPCKLAPSLFQTGLHYLPQTKVYQPIRLIQALYSLHFWYTGCFWLLKLCSCGYRKTNIHTYIAWFKNIINFKKLAFLRMFFTTYCGL